MQRKTITLLALVTILVSLACNFSAPTPHLPEHVHP